MEKSTKIIILVITFIASILILKNFIPNVCSDGWASSSIGRRGACSHHGGVAGWPGALRLIISIAITYILAKVIPEKTEPSKDKNKITQKNTVDSPTPEKTPLKTIEIAPQHQPNPDTRTIEKIPKKIIKPRKPTCPRCKSMMVLRVAKVGGNAGGKFWGCSKYPKCKGTRNY